METYSISVGAVFQRFYNIRGSNTLLVDQASYATESIGFKANGTTGVYATVTVIGQ